jgi:hypothetical protein
LNIEIGKVNGKEGVRGPKDQKTVKMEISFTFKQN